MKAVGDQVRQNYFQFKMIHLKVNLKREKFEK